MDVRNGLELRHRRTGHRYRVVTEFGGGVGPGVVQLRWLDGDPAVPAPRDHLLPAESISADEWDTVGLQP